MEIRDDQELTIADLKSAVSCFVACEALGIELDRNDRTACWHDGLGAHEAASLQVYEDHFFCHRCGIGGSVVDLLMQVAECTFGQAARKLEAWARRGEMELGTVKRVGRAEPELNDFTHALEVESRTEIDWGMWGPRLPGVTLAALEAHDVRQHVEFDQLLIPHYCDDSVVGVKVRHGNGRKEAWSGSVFTAALYAPAGIALVGDAVLVEGESDAWAVWSAGRGTCDLYAMPSGVGCWKDSFAKELEPYRRILVAFDNDEAGRRGRDKVCRALGWERAEPLFIPESYKDLREAIAGGWAPRLS